MKTLIMSAIGIHQSLAATLPHVTAFSQLSIEEQCKRKPEICKARAKKLPLKLLKKIIIKKIIKKKAKKLAKKIETKKLKRRTKCAKK